MKVYIVAQEPYHDNGNICGVFDSLEKAKASKPIQWTQGYYCRKLGDVVAESVVEDEDGNHFLVHEWEVQ